MAQKTDSDLVMIRVTPEQREVLRLIGGTYSEALSEVLDSDPEEYSAETDFAEQKLRAD